MPEMNKAVIQRISVIIISILLHFGVFFLSFKVDEPEEIERFVPILQLVDAVIIEEPRILQAPPPPEPEIIEEVNEAVIPDETIEEPAVEPVPVSEPEPIVSSDPDATISSDSQPSESVFLPFYKVEKRPEFITQAELKYPLQAKRNRLEGTVIVEADIDDEGLLQRVKIVKSAGFGFDEAAADMLENSTFRPAVMDGRAVGVRMRFTIKFEI